MTPLNPEVLLYFIIPTLTFLTLVSVIQYTKNRSYTKLLEINRKRRDIRDRFVTEVFRKLTDNRALRVLVEADTYAEIDPYNESALGADVERFIDNHGLRDYDDRLERHLARQIGQIRELLNGRHQDAIESAKRSIVDNLTEEIQRAIPSSVVWSKHLETLIDGQSSLRKQINDAKGDTIGKLLTRIGEIEARQGRHATSLDNLHALFREHHEGQKAQGAFLNEIFKTLGEYRNEVGSALHSVADSNREHLEVIENRFDNLEAQVEAVNSWKLSWDRFLKTAEHGYAYYKAKPAPDTAESKFTGYEPPGMVRTRTEPQSVDSPEIQCRDFVRPTDTAHIDAKRVASSTQKLRDSKDPDRDPVLKIVSHFAQSFDFEAWKSRMLKWNQERYLEERKRGPRSSNNWDLLHFPDRQIEALQGRPGLIWVVDVAEEGE